MLKAIRSVFQIKYWLVAFAGALFSLVVWKIMALEVRYIMAIAAGIVFLAVCMMAISRITDILVYAMVFNIPFAIFAKWLLVSENAVPGIGAYGINLGMAEFLLTMAYTVWFGKVFITRSQPFPTFRKIDFAIVLLILCQMISTIGTHDRELALFNIIHNIKHILMYLFIAHNVKRDHLKTIILILLFAVLLESSLALFQRVTGAVGLGVAKGKLSHAGFESQQSVPGLEQIRASGTTIDSHALGLYFSLILPVPLVFSMTRYLRPKYRIILAIILIIGIMGLVVTFTRSGWLSFAISATFAMGVIVFMWKQRKALVVAFVVWIIVSVCYPKAYSYLYNRLFHAPSEIVSERFVLNRTALSVWRHHFLFGAGPANYHNAIQEPEVTVYGSGMYPVHNSYLVLACEIGLCGSIVYWGIILTAITYCWKVLRCSDLLIRGLALAMMAAFFAYMLDGLTGPMFREAVPYAQLWTYIGLTVSLKRLLAEQEPERATVVPADDRAANPPGDQL